MAHESFEDKEVADILNREFVCIKVDREERPDIDAVYMAVCQAVTGSGGWPLTIVMTAEQKPFFAGTYFPKKSIGNMPGTIELLEGIAGLWRNERNRLIEAGNRITDFITEERIKGGCEPDISIAKEAYEVFKEIHDVKWGGFGQAPKFPAPHNLLFLMDYYQREKSEGALEMAETTLHAMARGGIFDQIGGGFSRYSTDEMWLIPHFEKMLYDNALLITAYINAYQITGNGFYADIAERTAEYILSELTDSEGGFYCGQDADSDGEEGKFYAFSKREIFDVLEKKDAEEFCRIYDITDKGNFEGKSVPNLIKGMRGWPAEDKRLKKLYDYRKQRAELHKDDKILLSWNSWGIIAMAKAGQALGKDKYTEAAIKAQRFIEENMTDENNRLFLRYRGGEAANQGQLDDYAVYALALLTLYQVTLDADFLKKAVLRAEQIVKLFEDEKGGYFINTHDSEQLIARPKETYDGALPSGNSVAATVFESLGNLTGEPKWIEISAKQHKFMAESAQNYPQGHTFYLLAMLKRLYPHKELICAGKKIPLEIREYLKTHTANDLCVIAKTEDNGEVLSQCAPFTANYPLPDEGVMWYLCQNGSCKAPTGDFSKLEF